MSIVVYTLLSVVLVSFVSLLGVFTLLWKHAKRHTTLLILVSLSAGTLFGDAFLHLLPEVVEKHGFTREISFFLLGGVLIFFVLEKMIHWRHCHGHLGHTDTHKHKASTTHLAPLNLFGDALHNFLDGLVIAGAYFVSIPAGVATTIAVVLHEVPQEIADFGVLLYSGLSRTRALLYNFLSSAVAIVGAIIGLTFGAQSETFIMYILPFAAGGFVYIAGSNLIPELHKQCELRESLWHFVAMFAGVLLMVLLLFIE
jgi:zinc and cadmium transporter